MRRFVLSMVGVALATLPANAQQPTFTETVVVTATGEETPLAQVSSAATVFDLAELEQKAEPTVHELLRLVPGATLLRSGLDGGVTSLFVRGAGSNQTLVMLDGVRLNSPYFGGYDWSLPLAAGLQRVEVVRGPYSALYGADALGGVVQLVTNRGAGNALRLLGEGGGSGWRRGELGFATNAGGFATSVDLAYRAGEGPLPNDDFSARLGSLYLTTEPTAGSRVGLLVRRSRTATEVPFAGATATPHRRTEAEETVLAVPLRLRELGGGELEATLSRVERTLAYRDPDDPWGFVASDTEADTTAARAVWHRAAGGGRHRLSIGGEWRRDEVTDLTSFGANLDGARLATSALFVQTQLRPTNDLEVLAGVRWDAADPWGREVSPRLTVSHLHGPLRLWGSWGTAFRAPSLGELYFPFSGNPDLEAERSRSAEAGVSMALGEGRGLVQLVGFANRVRNLIEFEYSTYAFANVGRAAMDGLELSWLHRHGPLRLRAGVTWLDARDADGLALVRRPEWSGHLAVGARSAAGLTGEVTLVWVGPRPDIDAVTFARVAQAGFVTASAAAAVPLGGGLRLRVRVDNLADRRYEEVNGYPAPGRRASIGADWALR